jgi:hypothetical protein
MRRSRHGFSLPLLFALLALGAPGIAAAQDMPPILAPLAQPPEASPKPTPAPITPSAEATIPPAVPAAPPVPAKKEHAAAVTHPTTVHHAAKPAAVKTRFAALMKRLAAAHAHSAPQHVALRQPEPSWAQAAVVPEPGFPPPGTVMPPPGYSGYYGPGYSPGPRERLVYGGPPPGVYGGWVGYRGRYPYYP